MSDTESRGHPTLLDYAVERAKRRQNRVADAITKVAGSMTFVYVHVVWFGLWIILRVERYPFGLLTMIVSLEAIFLSIFVLISQNRLTRQADRRAHLDLQINLLAEQEATMTLRLLQRICRHLGLEG